MRKKKQTEAPIAHEFLVRDGYEKRYVIDPEQTETFAPVNSTNYHIALGAKEALKTKLAKKDARVRLRLRSDRFELIVKLPKEVKTYVAHVAAQAEVLQTQSTSVAPHSS